MYFKFDGTINGTQCIIDIANCGKIRKSTMIKIINSTNVNVTGFVLDSEINEYKDKAKKYDEMHPKMTLNEDWVDNTISDDEIKELFNKFFAPLSVDTCELTIIDPYIFAKGTNYLLFLDIIKANVTSKKIRFIRNDDNDDSAIFNIICNDLKNHGFTITKVSNKSLHDRWWYTRKNGFVFGISFNGLSRKDSTIKLLEDGELNAIINKFGVF